MRKHVQISMDEFKARLEAQDVPSEHFAFRCPHCGHIQSPASLVQYMEGKDAGNTAYCCCEGRFNSGGPGCDWTLGGMLRIHTLEVITDDGHVVPVFEPATPEEALALMSTTVGNIKKCRVCGCDDFHACPGGCSWVEPGLCSACAGDEAWGCAWI